MSEESREHDAPDGDDRWVAFVPDANCPNSIYRVRFSRLQEARNKLAQMEQDSVEFEAMFNHVATETMALLEFGVLLAEESCKARRRTFEGIFN